MAALRDEMDGSPTYGVRSEVGPEDIVGNYPVKFIGQRFLSGPGTIRNIIFNELTERFSYYGNRAILVLFFVDVLRIEENIAVSIFSFFSAGVYISPLLGGYIADVLLGKYMTILVFIIVYFFGTVGLALSAIGDGHAWLAYVGLFLIAVGSGGIKPCVSAFGAEQFKHPVWVRYMEGARNEDGKGGGWLACCQGIPEGENDRLIEHYFSALYATINIGSLGAYIIVPVMRQNAGYGAAFGLASLFLGLAIVAFLWGSKHYVKPRPTGSTWNTVFGVCASAARQQYAAGGMFWCCKQNAGSGELAPKSNNNNSSSSTSFRGGESELTNLVREENDEIDAAPTSIRFPVTANESSTPANLSERARFYEQKGGWLNVARGGDWTDDEVNLAVAVWTLFPLLFSTFFFWCLFDQFGSSVVLLTRRMDHPEWIDIASVGLLNPLFVCLLIVPVNRYLFVYLDTLFNFNPLRRMGIGMFIASVSFVVCYFLQLWVNSASVNIALILLPYILITVAELFISVTGLTFSFQQAPTSAQSSILSIWYLANGVGDFVGGALFSVLAAWDPASLFLLFAILMLISTVPFIYFAYRFQPIPSRFL